MNIERIIDDVLLIVGEECCERVSGENPPLRRLIRLETEAAAARAVEETPRMALTGWRSLRDIDVSLNGKGGGTAELPEDFLFLLSVRLKCWLNDVGCILPADHWQRGRQRTGCEGVRATPSAPVCFHTVSDGKKGMEMWPCDENDLKIEEGWYMPRPMINDMGEIDIPPAAYRATLGYIVETLRI